MKVSEDFHIQSVLELLSQCVPRAQIFIRESMESRLVACAPL